MSLGTVLRIARRQWWVLAAGAALGLAAGATATATATPQYSATSTVFFSVNSGQSANELLQGSNYTLSLVQSYSKLATLPEVLGSVIDQLGLHTTPQALAKHVTVEAPANTVLMDITVEDPSSQRAAQVADAVADQLAATASTLSPSIRAGLLTVTTVSRATPATTPSSPNRLLDLVAGLVAGLVVGSAAVVVRQALGVAVATRDEVRETTAVPVIATVPTGRTRGRRRRARTLTTARDEAFRALRANLGFLQATQEVRALTVTSPSPGEGKTTTAIGLAGALAEAGSRVLLIDADLRRPAVAERLGLEGAAGLTTLLTGSASLQELLQTSGEHGLEVLTSGAVPPNPSELLTSPAMRQLLEQVRQRYDVVVLDCPPVLPVADAAALAREVDGAVLVVDSRRTTTRVLAEALHRLETAGARAVGIVLNRSATASSSYYEAAPSPAHALESGHDSERAVAWSAR